MTFTDLLSIAGAVLLALGGGAVVVLGLSRWLGGVWAGRILEQHRLENQLEVEALVRRRNVYSKLTTSLRVFLRNHEHQDAEAQQRFLEAYDEAAVWAPDSVMNSVGHLLDLVRRNTAQRGSVSEETLQAAYATCITELRKDAGFPRTTFAYRLVSF